MKLFSIVTNDKYIVDTFDTLCEAQKALVYYTENYNSASGMTIKMSRDIK